MSDIDDKLKNFRKEQIKQEQNEEGFRRWIRERIAVWSFILLVVIITIMWGVRSEAQETGPVNEGTWVVPELGVVICPFFVSEVDPNACFGIQDHWGPYPTAERCARRMAQMGEVFPSIATMQTGIPHWARVMTECEQTGEAT